MKRIAALALILFALPAAAETTTYRVMFGGEDVGHMIVNKAEDRVAIDFDYKQNGRGPTIAEEMTLDDRGYPIDWTITGTTTFGSSVDEFFRFADGTASWQDSTGPGEEDTGDLTGFYINQNGSPYSSALLARALLADEDSRFAVLPGGEASIVTGETRTYDGPDGELEVTAYQILGLSYNPGLVMLDSDGRFFATASPRFAMMREGYESADEDLRGWAEALSTERFVEIQAEVARSYDEPVRIRNVRVFDPIALELTELKDVVIYGTRIASVQDANGQLPGGEVIIEGDGGTLVPGMYEMHGHLGQGNALLNVAAGVTSVRDMGNENAVLEDLMNRINDGTIAGPRITRSCFIEGKSDFSAATGELVSTLEEGLALVRWCASRDFHQVKFYNSMRPEWAETLVAEAHGLGLRVAGHVPAFSTANAMIEAGFDEITHANQLLLGWVLEDGEDTRTLFRFTAMKRFPSLDAGGEDVRYTISQMRERNVAHDPTIAIHEYGLTAVNGEPAAMVAAVIDHLPTNVQRQFKVELFGTSGPEERAEYVAAFEFIIEIMRDLHEEGILLLPGTDLGGSFAYHRELELFETFGMTPAEVLRRASYDMAAYLNQDEDLGSIEKGKYADFFLVPGDPTENLNQLRQIRMVVSDGVVYFPSEIYPSFGIRPFSEVPEVTEVSDDAEAVAAASP
ncbi:MAG: amidohydrolase family protein [Woeseiaceae bacterium]|nr:amidohydrolase family protein [Woeseiaceae bacterium]